MKKALSQLGAIVRLTILCLATLGLMPACSEPIQNPDDALDCGRQFIEAIFKGDFKIARKLTLDDGENMHLLKDNLEKDYYARNAEDKRALKESSIKINSVEDVSDTISIINFLNSYDNKPAVLKTVKVNGRWQVDLKYTFSGNL